jgi:hypothetical protein
MTNEFNMSELVIPVDFVHIEQVSFEINSSMDRTITERKYKFNMELRIPKKLTWKSTNFELQCPKCSQKRTVVIRSGVEVVLSRIWNLSLWSTWAYCLYFIVVLAYAKSEFYMVLMVIFGYLIFPTWLATMLSANVGRLDSLNGSIGDGDRHDIFPR